MQLVSVIIPAFNAQTYISATLDSVLSNETVLEVIVVDDCSTDQTVAIARAYGERSGRVTVTVSSENRGAGHSRNTGITLAKGEYFFFLDADDILAPGAIDEVMSSMKRTGCDVMVFRYTHLCQENGPPLPMHKTDEDTWSAICGASPMRVTSLDETPRLLYTVNFPWNKVVSADLCRRTGLFFSPTHVHNDVYAHWHIYINAQRIGLINKALIQHRVIRSRDQLSNVLDRKRFDIFQAVEDVETRLFCDPEIRKKFYFWFLLFRLDVFRWISGAIDPVLHAEFLRRVETCHESFSDADYRHIYSLSREVALITLNMKYHPDNVLSSSRRTDQVRNAALRSVLTLA